jgi:peptidoglycan/LPS O-acetylase OafA/YrhL
LDPKVSLSIDSAGSGTIGSSMIISMLSGVARLLDLNYNILKFLIDTVLLIIFTLIFCTLEYKFAMKFIDNKFPSSLSSLFTYIGTSSYCVYLFHRPFLALWNAGTNFIGNLVLRDIIVLFVALPILFILCYHLQMFELNLKKYFSHEKTLGKDLSFKRSITGSNK